MSDGIRGTMEEIWIEKGMEWLPLLSALLVFLLFQNLRRHYHPEKILLRKFRELSGMVRHQKAAVSWYQRTEQRLLKNGAAFHYGKWVDPIRYLALRVTLAGVGMVTCMSLSPMLASLAAMLLFFLPDGMLFYLNSRDNERILPELKLVYHALEIQIQAGVYLTDALTECYGSVQDVRLRSALLDLAGDIVMKADIYDSLERFQGKFDNRYIDSLCIIILQALESGQALELLGDIGEQLRDMEETVLTRKKNSLDRSVTFYQLGILAAVLGISLYACITHMMGTAAGF